MTDKILFVDDDPSLLAAMQRTFRKRFTIDTATGAAAALDLLARQGPYAVIVADLGMPGMSGARLLEACLEKFPETMRIMLTGDADNIDALQAMDRAQVFQILNKPCPADILSLTLEKGLHHYHSIMSKKEASAPAATTSIPS